VRLIERRGIAIAEHDKHQNDFDELEAALEEANAGTTARYRQLYETFGGEQFRSGLGKLKRKCDFYCMLMIDVYE